MWSFYHDLLPERTIFLIGLVLSELYPGEGYCSGVGERESFIPDRPTVFERDNAMDTQGFLSITPLLREGMTLPVHKGLGRNDFSLMRQKVAKTVPLVR